MLFLFTYHTTEIALIIIYFPIYRLEIFGRLDSSSFVMYSETDDRFLNKQFPLPSTWKIRYCESEKQLPYHQNNGHISQT